MRKTELVFVPIPGIGHLVSAVELSKLIVHRHSHISILILIMKLPFDSSTVNAYVDRQSREFPNPSRLTFLTLPTPPTLPNTPSHSLFFSLVDLHKPLVKQAVENRVRSGSPKPAGFILDMFCTSMMDIADELHVPSYIYFPSGANLLCLALYAQSLAHENGVRISVKFSDPDVEMDDVPGFNKPVPNKVVPAVLLDEEFGSTMLLNHIKRFKQSKGILVNTYMELESGMIQALVDQHGKGKIPAVYPVGPLMDLSKNKSDDYEESSNITEWLDEQPDSTVVFLCFGSRGYFRDEQVKEIATGLERGGHRFLWSLRRPPEESQKLGVPSERETFEDALPQGFLDRTASRGKIIGWAPQVSILGHRAVGGFVSHCGWNSILESLWFGVPMATWPLYAEQQLNAFEMVKELGLAVEIRMDYRREWRSRKENMLVKAEEIENGVKKLMGLDQEMKERVREMSEKGKKVLQEGGSSSKWLDSFLAHVLELEDATYN